MHAIPVSIPPMPQPEKHIPCTSKLYLFIWLSDYMLSCSVMSNSLWPHISFIENRLKKFVSKYEEKNGKRSRANVSSTISTYRKRNLHTDEMESRECTRFLIDYPKNSAIYNTIKNKNDKERLEFVAMVIGFVGKGMIKQFGSMPPVIQDSRNNKVEYMNDELSFSFN